MRERTHERDSDLAAQVCENTLANFRSVFDLKILNTVGSRMDAN